MLNINQNHFSYSTLVHLFYINRFSVRKHRGKCFFLKKNHLQGSQEIDLMYKGTKKLSQNKLSDP